MAIENAKNLNVRIKNKYEKGIYDSCSRGDQG